LQINELSEGPKNKKPEHLQDCPVSPLAYLKALGDQVITLRLSAYNIIFLFT